MFSCKKASELIIKSQDRHLSIFEKLSLSGHLMMCKFCREVKGKFAAVRKMLCVLSEKIENGEAVGEEMSRAAIEKIKLNLKEELNKERLQK